MAEREGFESLIELVRLQVTHSALPGTLLLPFLPYTIARYCTLSVRRIHSRIVKNFFVCLLRGEIASWRRRSMF